MHIIIGTVLFFLGSSSSAMIKPTLTRNPVHHHIAHPLVAYHEMFGRMKHEVQSSPSMATVEILRNLPSYFYSRNAAHVSPFGHLLGTLLFKNSEIVAAQKKNFLSIILKNERIPTHEIKAFSFIKDTYFNTYCHPEEKNCVIDRNVSGMGFGSYHTLLYEAVRKNQIYASMIALDQGANPNEKVGFLNDDLPLKAAIRAKNPSLVSILLEAGANINPKTPLQPIHEAAIAGNEEIFDMLLAHGADMNQLAEKPGYRLRPMDMAIEHNHVGIVKKLKAKGIRLYDIPWFNKFEDVLAKGHYEIADLMEKEGACHPDYYKLVRSEIIKSKL